MITPSAYAIERDRKAADKKAAYRAYELIRDLPAKPHQPVFAAPVDTYLALCITVSMEISPAQRKAWWHNIDARMRELWAGMFYGVE